MKKKKTVKYGKHPANARVDIDYSSEKPKIKFSYPNTGKSAKEQAKRQHSVGIHTLILLIIGYLIIALLLRINFVSVSYPKNCSVSWDSHYINTSIYVDVDGNNASSSTYKNWIQGANLTCDGRVYKIKFYKENNLMTKAHFSGYEQSSFLFLGLFLSLMWLVGLPLYYLNKLITKLLLKSRKYQKWFPKHQAEGFTGRRNKKYIKFFPKDVENLIVEIPYFQNIELNYKTKGDFSKQLLRIKIHEHQYYDFKKGKKGKKKVRIGEWYARFYFKEVPKDGFLEVIFQ